MCSWRLDAQSLQADVQALNVSSFLHLLDLGHAIVTVREAPGGREASTSGSFGMIRCTRVTLGSVGASGAAEEPPMVAGTRIAHLPAHMHRPISDVP